MGSPYCPDGIELDLRRCWKELANQDNSIPEDWATHTLITGLPRRKTFIVSTKNRWKGKSLLDAFSSEYTARPLSYYKTALEHGFLRALKQGTVDRSNVSAFTQSEKRRRIVDNPILCGREEVLHDTLLSEVNSTHVFSNTNVS